MKQFPDLLVKLSLQQRRAIAESNPQRHRELSPQTSQLVGMDSNLVETIAKYDDVHTSPPSGRPQEDSFPRRGHLQTNDAGVAGARGRGEGGEGGGTWSREGWARWEKAWGYLTDEDMGQVGAFRRLRTFGPWYKCQISTFVFLRNTNAPNGERNVAYGHSKNQGPSALATNLENPGSRCLSPLSTK